jgi:NADPH:quinone reductase-like Zn-dependent oxidoreductase
MDVRTCFSVSDICHLVTHSHDRMLHFSNDKARLDEIARLMNDGKLKPVVDSVYPFADLFKAYERIMSSRARGKVVIDVTTA